MKIRFITAVLFAIICFAWSPETFAGWKKQNSGTLAWLRSVYFFDAQRGFVVGSNGTILQTVNAGETWTQIESTTTDNLRDIAFLNEKDGWILAERNKFSKPRSAANSYLLHTTDGGATWQIENFPNNNLNSSLVRFVQSEKKIWAVGETGALYALAKTTGARWQKQPPPTNYLLLNGFSVGEKQTWLVGAGGSLLSTTDNGANWRSHDFGESIRAKPRFNAAFFIHPKIGWIAGARGTILATVNGGGQWFAQNSETNADLLDVQFINSHEGWAAGDAGTLLHTVDGGAKWIAEETIAQSRRLERLFFVGQTATQNSAGWAVGFGGTILVRVN